MLREIVLVLSPHPLHFCLFPSLSNSFLYLTPQADDPLLASVIHNHAHLTRRVVPATSSRLINLG